ncbi:hypothetical protein TNIN_97361 [Trichonephila inaurata madagascariensis]|uniref:Uncharacterized protein n=1 Tax=Trichonephila inaurata madagascariensis TaxID=2747483 RepID=A0A8X6WX66_9ARAC|nr:hypothetical protein TNIN_97361 [Trichonephila inaurata madagascariensis]
MGTVIQNECKGTVFAAVILFWKSSAPHPRCHYEKKIFMNIVLLFSVLHSCRWSPNLFPCCSSPRQSESRESPKEKKSKLCLSAF